MLTDGERLPPETAAYLGSEVGVADFALGGPAAAADPSATPLVGADRYATSVAVAERFFPSPTIVGFANGYAFADALSGSVDISEKGGPLILLAPDALPRERHHYLESIEATVTIGIVYGGTAVVSTSSPTRSCWSSMAGRADQLAAATASPWRWRPSAWSRPVSVGAGAAYAYWTSQGAGSGTAITTTGASATVHVIAVTGGTDPSTLLSPGQSAELVLELDNPNSYP